VTKSAIRPGSNFNRQGGSIFHQRQQQTALLRLLSNGMPIEQYKQELDNLKVLRDEDMRLAQAHQYTAT
ncbi:hypothetical protein V0R48_21645, partial [Pseudomonas alcaligenes]|nr:hypothetical protein [Pseudomonas alcaligenes]